MAKTNPPPLPSWAPTMFSLLALAALTATGGCARPEQETGEIRSDVTADFRLPFLRGDSLVLASLADREVLGPPDFNGQVVLVEFWATWCVPCHKQAEVLEELYREVRDDGVQFLAVDLGEEEEKVREYVADKPFSYPVLLDPEDNLTYEMGIYGLPTVMVVNRQGQVTYFETGLIDKEDLAAELRRAAG